MGGGIKAAYSTDQQQSGAADRLADASDIHLSEMCTKVIECSVCDTQVPSSTSR